MTKKDILKILDRILDPDLRDRSIVEMGFVREDDIEVDEKESMSPTRWEAPFALTAPRWALLFITP